MRDVTQLVATCPKGFMTWQGPIIPLVILCHPDMVRAITNASGTYTGLAPALFPSLLSAFFLFSLCIQTRLLPLMPSVPALVSWAPLGPQEVSIQGPLLEEAPIWRRQIWTERFPNLVWSGIVRRRLWQPRGEARCLLGRAGKLPGGGDAGNGPGTMSRNVFKAERRTIPWATLASQAWPQTYPPPSGPEQ